MSNDFSLELVQQKFSLYRQTGIEMADGPSSSSQTAFENYLRQGVIAFRKLQAYDENAREAARSGIAVPPEVPALIEATYREWLEQGLRVEHDIERLGMQFKNLAAFQEACATVKARIAAFNHNATIDSALSGDLFTAEYVREVEKVLAQ